MIIDALVERGYGILEVTWVADAPSIFSYSSSSGGMWAATYRNPLDGKAGYVTGRFLGAILGAVERLPDPLRIPAEDEVTA